MHSNELSGPVSSAAISVSEESVSGCWSQVYFPLGLHENIFGANWNRK